jgi:hypothetical protein
MADADSASLIRNPACWSPPMLEKTAINPFHPVGSREGAQVDWWWFPMATAAWRRRPDDSHEGAAGGSPDEHWRRRDSSANGARGSPAKGPWSALEMVGIRVIEEEGCEQGR